MEMYFTAQRYGQTYNGILELIEVLSQNPYDWEKLTAARTTWAGEAK